MDVLYAWVDVHKSRYMLEPGKLLHSDHLGVHLSHQLVTRIRNPWRY